MNPRMERRHYCVRIIGVERRGAPIQTLEGNPLPDPTRLIDEDFAEPGLKTSPSSPVQRKRGTREEKDH